MKFESIDAWMDYLKSKSKVEEAANDDQDDVDQYEQELNEELNREAAKELNK
tara:strand:- start:5731 stop:5886 length:156 start_codon:yes stop_codon:yes gene_type:complete